MESRRLNVTNHYPIARVDDIKDDKKLNCLTERRLMPKVKLPIIKLNVILSHIAWILGYDWAGIGERAPTRCLTERGEFIGLHNTPPHAVEAKTKCESAQN